MPLQVNYLCNHHKSIVVAPIPVDIPVYNEQVLHGNLGAIF